MLFTDLNEDTLDRIGLFLNAPQPVDPVYGRPPVNGIQGIFNQTVALRRNATTPKFSSVPRTFGTTAAMIHRDDLVSGAALFYALSRGAPVRHVVEIIARCPQALSTLDKHQNSVLHAAALGRYGLDVLQMVCGAPGNWAAKKVAVNRENLTPMHMALGAGAQFEVVEFLLDGAREVLTMATQDGDLPVHTAIRNVAALRVVALLIDTEDGDVLMSRNGQRNLPLHLAGEFGVSERGVIALLSRPEIHSVVRQSLNEDSHTPLYLAVYSKQDISILKLLVDCDKKVLTTGLIPLHLAVSKRASFEVTKLLIDPDKTVLTMSWLNDYPFHIAIQNRASVEIMELLLDDDCVCMQRKSRNFKGPLHVACETGCTLDVIKFLVEMDKSGLSRPSDISTNYQTPLHLALCKKRVCMSLDSIEYIVNADRDVLRMVNRKKEMPLHVALMNELDVGIIEFLAKADRHPLTEKSYGDFTPLRLAVSRRGYFSMHYKSVIPLLIDDDEYVLFEQAVSYQHVPLLHYALQSDTEDSVPENFKVLIDSNKKVLLHADYETRYPIHVAIKSCKTPETLQFLVDDQRTILTRTPVPNTKKAHPCSTPLHYFLELSRTYDMETIIFLVGGSKEVLCTPDRWGEVPLHYAIRHGIKFPHVIQLLIDVDKDCLLECGPSGCPLQLAVMCRWDVNMLSDLTDPLKKVFRLHEKQLNTPLHTSILFKSDDATVRFLVESDPYVLRLQNLDKCTPLHAAVNNKTSGLNTYGYYNSQEPFHEWGTDMIFLLAQTDTSVLVLPNTDGDTALSSAVERGLGVEVLQYLIDWEGDVLRMSTNHRSGNTTALHKSIIATSRHELSEDAIRLLVEHVGGQDALLLGDGHGNTPLHAAIDQKLSPKIIQLLAYQSMPAACVARSGRVMPTLACVHPLGMGNIWSETPLHMAMSCARTTQIYDTVLYLVQLDATALGKISKHKQTPLTIAVDLVLKNVMPVFVFEILVRSYPPALVVNDSRYGSCKFPLVCALKTAGDECALGVDTLNQVLGLLIDGDRVVMRRYGLDPTPSELAVANNLNRRVVKFLRRYE